jgi:dephospho-CoA kinase
LLKVGITGNIGSGKTTVCKIFETLRIPVFNADDSAISVYRDKEVAIQVKKLFGEDIYKGEEIDRKKLAAIVFSDKELLEKLNAIIHPATIRQFEDWVKQQQAPYVLKEAAILFESGTDKGTDKVITVLAPEETRIQRVLEKNPTWTRTDVLKRQQNQWSDEEKVKCSNYVIYNDGREFLITQVMRIHNELIKSPT